MEAIVSSDVEATASLRTVMEYVEHKHGHKAYFGMSNAVLISRMAPNRRCRMVEPALDQPHQLDLQDACWRCLGHSKADHAEI